MNRGARSKQGRAADLPVPDRIPASHLLLGTDVAPGWLGAGGRQPRPVTESPRPLQ